MDHSPTVNRIRRVTKGGRQLSYVLTVIQQPRRARACGSGAKSSSDRRPVDPPPVVELKIINEDSSKPEDITFAYEANFFLFVTLEAARPLSRGKLQQQQHQSAVSPIPILTGMPVSGMAYLDRPSEAGYFIFPDLSVRHEGHFVLSFNLYEETKNESDHDADKKSLVTTDPHLPDSSFDWRLEVKSAPFTVYSAKKFPGLEESTYLSRIVAEQGIRVRLRRDVRMRRRDRKSDENTTHEDHIRRPEEEITFEERTRSQSLSGSSDSSRFSQAESVNSNLVMSNLLHHHHPPPPPYSKQTTMSRPQVKSSFVDHLHGNTCPPSPFPAKSHPLSLAELSPAPMKPYPVSSTTTYNPQDSRPRLPPVRYHLNSCEPDAAVAISPAVTHSKSTSHPQAHVPASQPSINRPSVRPPRSPNGISIVKLLSPIKIPLDDAPVSSTNSYKVNTPYLSNGDFWCERKGENLPLFDSPLSVPELNTNNKRPISSIVPRTSMPIKTRLIHGQRLLSPPAPPLSPPLLPRIVPDEEETDEMEKIMIYKRASGEIKERRGLPIFS